jgi:hypothetical protein
MRVAAAVLFLTAALTPEAASAQASAPGPYVIDIRGAMSGAPGDVSFYPAVPLAVRVPQRAFGLGLGAHVYAWRLGVAHLGFGVDIVRARGSAKTSPSETATSSTGGTATAAGAGTLTAAMNVTTIAPQLSFNFGARDGWSYLSAGYGAGATSAEVNIPTSADGTGAASRQRRTAALNFGGGARWFLREHLAVGFDIRFHRLRATNGLPGTQIVNLSVGVSLR